MARYINSTPQYFDSSGNPVVSGLLYFYESETNTKKTTYADSLETIPNSNPVELDAGGRAPNIFYSGSARVVLKDSDNNQIWERDPVGGENALSDFLVWDSVVIYDTNDIVETASGDFYISMTNTNQDNDPTLSAGNNANWEQINFVGTYNAQKTYAAGDLIKTSDGLLWYSVTGSNTGNNPATNNGDNWLPAIDPLKIDSLTKVIGATGGGALTALRVNEIRDGSTYTLPLASSVESEQTITVSLPERYRASTPTISTGGSDTITDSDGTDTSITFGSLSFGKFTLTSDGVSNWSF